MHPAKIADIVCNVSAVLGIALVCFGLGLTFGDDSALANGGGATPALLVFIVVIALTGIAMVAGLAAHHLRNTRPYA